MRQGIRPYPGPYRNQHRELGAGLKWEKDGIKGDEVDYIGTISIIISLIMSATALGFGIAGFVIGSDLRPHVDNSTDSIVTLKDQTRGLEASLTDKLDASAALPPECGPFTTPKSITLWGEGTTTHFYTIPLSVVDPTDTTTLTITTLTVPPVEGRTCAYTITDVDNGASTVTLPETNAEDCELMITTAMGTDANVTGNGAYSNCQHDYHTCTGDCTDDANVKSGAHKANVQTKTELTPSSTKSKHLPTSFKSQKTSSPMCHKSTTTDASGAVTTKFMDYPNFFWQCNSEGNGLCVQTKYKDSVHHICNYEKIDPSRVFSMD